jgi:hypothetical protein
LLAAGGFLPSIAGEFPSPRSAADHRFVLLLDDGVRTDIRAGKYVSMYDVLPVHKRWLPVGKAKDATPMPFRLWTEAFGLFAAAHLQDHPGDGSAMMKYLSELAAFARDPDPSTYGAFYFYDVAFRRARAYVLEQGWPMDSVSWGTFKHDIWAQAQQTARDIHPPSKPRFAPAVSGPRFPFPPRATVPGSDVCFKFNTPDLGCRVRNCSWRHVCLVCHGDGHGVGAPSCPGAKLTVGGLKKD